MPQDGLGQGQKERGQTTEGREAQAQRIHQGENPRREEVMTRGYMGARGQFDAGDEDYTVPHCHPCEVCFVPVECEDGCDEDQQTIVYCQKHREEAKL